VTQVELLPRGPYSLADSAGHPDPTRRMAGGVLDLRLLTPAGPAAARVWQRHDGVLGVRLRGADSAAALDRLRFVLAVDADHAPFLRLAERDRLLAPLVRRRPGMRPARLATPHHALVRAMAGQLVTGREAMLIERRLLAAVCASDDGLRTPPGRSDLGRLSAAAAERAGLSPRRAGALVRLARVLDFARLDRAPTADVLRRLTAEPAVGPWTAGIVCGQGLGRPDGAPDGDLGLIKLCSALLGRRADAGDTARLLDRYGEWRGLAAAHLLTHPLAHGQHWREPVARAERQRRRVA
jgi:3-methyladenine DNA glycosylase/8-oxoguanine DNA glycosylase